MFKTLTSIAKCECPKCKSQNLFKNTNPYNFNDIDKMYDYCPKCNFDVRNETGFYWFSMYVSYALSVGFCLINFVIAGLIFGFFEKMEIYLIANAIILLLLLPFIFRWSRIISIYLTMKMDKY
ncbi:MAG: hypothetical protein H6553_03610 [Chitinophagales bacterium]|nr:hypothetical protein [Chitinophagales bacterium]